MGVRILILIDTHALIWAVDDSKKLSRAAASAIRRARHSGGLAISAITIWEISSLLTRGRVRAFGTVEASIQIFLEDVAVRPITPEICALGVLFPDDERIRRSPLLRTVW
jgi:PIN domain nuclease of toxin-antitoxin system